VWLGVLRPFSSAVFTVTFFQGQPGFFLALPCMLDRHYRIDRGMLPRRMPYTPPNYLKGGIWMDGWMMDGTKEGLSHIHIHTAKKTHTHTHTRTHTITYNRHASPLFVSLSVSLSSVCNLWYILGKIDNIAMGNKKSTSGLEKTINSILFGALGAVDLLTERF
jgi:hypothetical protein